MGLFDFAKDVGRQLFDTDAEAADNIKQHIDIKLSGIKNVEVAFDDGIATICGECVNEATKTKAILIAGDVKGVEQVIADDLTFPEPLEEEKEKVEVLRDRQWRYVGRNCQAVLRQSVNVYANS